MTQTVFEQMDGTNVQQGGYETPAITLLPEEELNVSIWGQRYKQWLRENHRVLYYNLLTSGKLNKQAVKEDERAESLFFRLVQEIMEREGVTEALKAVDPIAWVHSILFTTESRKSSSTRF